MTICRSDPLFVTPAQVGVQLDSRLRWNDEVGKVILGPLNHVGVAVQSLAEAVAHWREAMGATKVHDPIAMPEQGVTVCFVDTPNSQIELLEPMGENSPILKFLERNPQGGQHHLAFEVPDIAEARAFYEGQGKRILGPTRIGAHGTPVFFLHPKDMGGLLIEIMEPPSGHR